jgi:hypothetical protein
MNHLTYQWKKRSLIVVIISLVASGLLWLLSLTDWAMAMNDVVREPHGEGPDAPAILMLIMPLIKVTMLTLVPAAICLAVLNISNALRKLRGLVAAR